MRYTKLVLIVLAIMLALAMVGCSSSDSDEGDAADEPAGASELAVGTMVGAEWIPGSLYLAEVTAVGDDGMITVTWADDGTESEVAEEDVFIIEEQEWSVGDRVLAVWATAKFYSGTVESIEGEEYIIAWDDGSEASAATADMMLAYDEEYAQDAVGE